MVPIVVRQNNKVALCEKVLLIEARVGGGDRFRRVGGGCRGGGEIQGGGGKGGGGGGLCEMREVRSSEEGRDDGSQLLAGGPGREGKERGK